MRQIPIFVVNLKKDTEKREHMQVLCKKYSLKCQFIDAVYGKDLSEKEISEVYDKERALKKLGRELALGEIGCSLSHMSIYKKMIKENIKKALILEDDVTFDKSLLDALNSINDFPKDWELILFNYYRDFPVRKLYCTSFWERSHIGKNFQSVRFTEMMHSTAGYIINYDGALRLINILEKGLYKPIDHYTGDENDINLYGIFPKVVDIDSHFVLHSNIEVERKDLSSGTNKTLLNKVKSLLMKFTIFQIINKIKNKTYDRFYCLVRLGIRLKKPKQYAVPNGEKP